MSKVTKYNFIDIESKEMIGIVEKRTYKIIDMEYVGVKDKQVFFCRLYGGDRVLGVEME